MTTKKQKEQFKSVTIASLSDLKLTSLYEVDQFSHICYLNLSNNYFTRLSKAFNGLLCLKTLILDSNQVKQIEKDFHVVQLKTLSLQFNGMCLI